jgi:hypothetical protein
MKRFAPVLIVALVAALAVGAFLAHSRLSHAASGPISITHDSDFTACGCVSSGSGTTSSPYIIGPLSISHVSGDAITIDGTNLTKSFEILNVTITSNGGNGIVLNHINPSGSQTIVAKVFGTQTSIQSNTVGILVENSSYVTLDGAGENPSGPGIRETGAGTINKNTNGAIDVENSSHVTVEGWQLSANGADGMQDWIGFEPSVSIWGVGGVRLFGDTSSTVDHNGLNNDTSISFTVFNSSHNTISNNTADYPFTINFLITDGSAYNTLTGNVASTGDFMGLLVADPLPGSQTLATYGPTHDNTITGNTIHTDGPIGNETHAGIVPAFLGGVVVLNGTYNNQILNNTTFASFGADLTWAQAVPNSSTPIGVDNYPPTEHCNVTASEGGGGVSNHNGNVWSGNTFRTIDPCIPPQ